MSGHYKYKNKLFTTSNDGANSLIGRITILENNVYKVTYYEIISGASGTIILPSGATINSGEFTGANCVLSEIDGSNKPTYVTPLDGGGNPVTATLNVGTGAWVKSAATVSVNVALIYSVNITALNYSNLNNFYIIDNIIISSFTQVLTNSAPSSVTSLQLAGIISDETGSGALVFGTSPTFTTNITTPLIIGGSAVGSTIQYKGTSGVGTSTVAAHQFLVGNNGATAAGSIYNSGAWNIGVGTGNAAPTFSTFRVGVNNGLVDIGSIATGYSTIWLGQATPSASNYSILMTGSSALTMQASSSVQLSYAQGTSSFTINATGLILSSGLSFNGTVASSGVPIPFNFVTPANTNQTLSTNIPNFKVTGSTKQWATGTLATQYFNYFSANTVSFVGASTATNVYGAYFETPLAGTNATITNAYAVGTDDGMSKLGKAEIGTWDQSSSYFVLKYLGMTSSSNYALLQSSAGTTTLNSSGITQIAAAGTSRLTINIGDSLSTIHYNFTPRNRTTLTASAEIPVWKFGSSTQQWATGALTIQRNVYLATQTLGFVGASTITDSYGLYVEAATAGTNATITNNYAAGFGGNIKINTGSGAGQIQTSEYFSNLGAIYCNQTTISGGTYSLSAIADANTILNGKTGLNFRVNGSDVFSTTATVLTFIDAFNIAFATGTGTKIGTTTAQKIGFWNATPIVQPTTAIAASTLVSNGGTTLTSTDTIDGYTLLQIIKALRNTGLLA